MDRKENKDVEGSLDKGNGDGVASKTEFLYYIAR